MSSMSPHWLRVGEGPTAVYLNLSQVAHATRDRSSLAFVMADGKRFVLTGEQSRDAQALLDQAAEKRGAGRPSKASRLKEAAKDPA